MRVVVQIILQDTNILHFETHPFHLHGYSFYIVGRGYGNYDPDTSPATFNLNNPPLRNTFGVPAGGWLALRFRADNPGKFCSLKSIVAIKLPAHYEDAVFLRSIVNRIPRAAWMNSLQFPPQ